jgi:hypothetical protein
VKAVDLDAARRLFIARKIATASGSSSGARAVDGRAKD